MLTRNRRVREFQFVRNYDFAQGDRKLAPNDFHACNYDPNILGVVKLEFVSYRCNSIVVIAKTMICERKREPQLLLQKLAQS